jgi:GNAT superfamily N-acetyltransferase
MAWACGEQPAHMAARRLQRQLRHLSPAPPAEPALASAVPPAAAGVQRLGPSDLQDVLDLVSVAFSEHGETTPRQVMKPHVYREGSMHEHWGIRDGGRLLAVAGVTPRTLTVGDASLKTAGVGGVAVHPRLGRNQGLMTRLMDHTIADLRAEGYVLSMLSGLRQRYAHFGYEKAGQNVSLTLTSRNFELGGAAATAAVAAAATLRLCPMEAAHLPAAQALHAAQSVRWERGDPDSSATEFLLVLSAWNARPFAALDAGTGEVVGYLVADAAAGVQGGGRTADPSKLQEVVGRDDATTLSMIYRWVTEHGAPFSSQDPAATMTHWELPSWQVAAAAAGQYEGGGLGRQLLEIAETTR